MNFISQYLTYLNQLRLDSLDTLLAVTSLHYSRMWYFAFYVHT